MLTAVASCTATPPAPATPPVAMAIPFGPPAATSTKDVVLLIRMHLDTIEVPVGTISGSEELWSYLDEERLSSGGSMGRNGLRVAVGKQSLWPDVSKILIRLTGRHIQESTGIAIPGSPYCVVLKPAQPTQLIFLSNADRTLQGQDFPPGENQLRLLCTLNQDDPTQVMISAVPQVASTQHQWHVVQHEAGPSMELSSQIFGFSPLAFQTIVSSKDFIVIGPGPEARRPYTVGHHFMVREKDGVEFETVLVLIPEVVAERAQSRK